MQYFSGFVLDLFGKKKRRRHVRKIIFVWIRVFTKITRKNDAKNSRKSPAGEGYPSSPAWRASSSNNSATRKRARKVGESLIWKKVQGKRIKQTITVLNCFSCKGDCQEYTQITDSRPRKWRSCTSAFRRYNSTIFSPVLQIGVTSDKLMQKSLHPPGAPTCRVGTIVS